MKIVKHEETYSFISKGKTYRYRADLNTWFNYKGMDMLECWDRTPPIEIPELFKVLYVRCD